MHILLLTLSRAIRSFKHLQQVSTHVLKRRCVYVPGLRVSGTRKVTYRRKRGYQEKGGQETRSMTCADQYPIRVLLARRCCADMVSCNLFSNLLPKARSCQGVKRTGWTVHWRAFNYAFGTMGSGAVKKPGRCAQSSDDGL